MHSGKATHGAVPQTVEVAIIGGGPTGLFTGLLLQRLGVSVCVLDAKPRSLELGRADALNARTQQYFEVADLLDEILPQGLKCNTSSTFGDGEFISRQDKWWVSLEHTLHKNFLMIGQPVIEKMMSAKLGDAVRYNEQVVCITEENDVVEVVCDSGRTVRCKYAVGADGARSMVRKSMGVTFAGTKPEMLWAVLDTFIDTDFPTCPEIITFQLNGQSRVSWIPRERGLCRFYVLLEGHVTQARAEESIKNHMAPYRVEFKETEWYSTFDVKERIASSFISRNGAGRILLAGDAAHVHSVNGGQGLNTGIADAFSLAWRLATVLKSTSLKEGAAGKIVRSYDDERRSTAQGVIDVAAALVRDTVREAKTYVATIERNAGYITGMGVSYHDTKSPIITASQHGFWKAGSRCPDVVLISENGKDGSSSSSRSMRLYTQASYGKHLVLSVGKPLSPDFGFSETADCFDILPRSTTPITTSQEDTAPNKNGNSAAVCGGRAAFAADWVSAEDSFVVVVRPDMYIGYIGSDEKCREYLGKLFTP